MKRIFGGIGTINMSKTQVYSMKAHKTTLNMSSKRPKVIFKQQTKQCKVPTKIFLILSYSRSWYTRSSLFDKIISVKNSKIKKFLIPPLIVKAFKSFGKPGPHLVKSRAWNKEVILCQWDDPFAIEKDSLSTS